MRISEGGMTVEMEKKIHSLRYMWWALWRINELNVEGNKINKGVNNDIHNYNLLRIYCVSNTASHLIYHFANYQILISRDKSDSTLNSWGWRCPRSFLPIEIANGAE